MEGRGGRPPGRAPTALELRHLELLRELRVHASQRAADFDERIEDFVLELIDSGCSVRTIADALGVGSSTVHVWTKRARSRAH